MIPSSPALTRASERGGRGPGVGKLTFGGSVQSEGKVHGQVISGGSEVSCASLLKVTKSTAARLSNDTLAKFILMMKLKLYIKWVQCLQRLKPALIVPLAVAGDEI